mmetsp:Transcript_89123/g.250929  ORF Transcript_89123/g.250929 Transcript_89123/m.250929 type:complete len:248 (-) Transcript_89123:205-948(-)
MNSMYATASSPVLGWVALSPPPPMPAKAVAAAMDTGREMERRCSRPSKVFLGSQRCSLASNCVKTGTICIRASLRTSCVATSATARRRSSRTSIRRPSVAARRAARLGLVVAAAFWSVAFESSAPKRSSWSQGCLPASSAGGRSNGISRRSLWQKSPGPQGSTGSPPLPRAASARSAKAGLVRTAWRISSGEAPCQAHCWAKGQLPATRQNTSTPTLQRSALDDTTLSSMASGAVARILGTVRSMPW